jgi:hypothetical protein
MPLYLSYWGIAYAELHRFDDACRCVGEATTTIETTKERWWEAAFNYPQFRMRLRGTSGDENLNRKNPL